MINDVSKWAGSITISVLIVTLLEMLLPENKCKKYIKTIMSIYILFTIISPIVKAVSNNQIDIENFIDTQSKMDLNTSYSNSNTLQTNSNIENVYEINLKKDIIAKLTQKGYKTETIDIKYEKEDSNNFGKIYEINLYIKGTNENKQSKIPKIEISIGDTGLKKELSNNSCLTENEKNDLKSYLSSTYGLQIDNITIEEV